MATRKSGSRRPNAYLPGTLRSGKEFAIHGAIILEDFDVLHHLQAVRVQNNKAENASNNALLASPTSDSPPPKNEIRFQDVTATPLPAVPLSGGACGQEQQKLGTPLKQIVRKHVAQAKPLRISTNPDNYPVTSTGWGGIHDKTIPQRQYMLEELKSEFGMTVIDWDGQSSRPLIGMESRIIAVLGGRPNNPKYVRLTEEAARQLDAARGQLNFTPSQAEGHCGAFSSVSYGISFGGGQERPGNLAHTLATSRIMETLFTMDGHLVLWDLKLVIRFPPGSTILILSAILRHSNVLIQANETRYSFTQFTTAGLFCWVDNSFKSDLTVAEETRNNPEHKLSEPRLVSLVGKTELIPSSVGRG
ncbi:hypothetical protein B0H17DRAFT_1214488 [Mycena rosella]|uniref:Uncharacterized protein n=1 Tax=Mycena rosella TaxID=1033263 RepID=A0AAD7CMT4_MYCRO|nr:hypothetical protein B0H17DRAFT_1214488 [Mycena rosella]